MNWLYVVLLYLVYQASLLDATENNEEHPTTLQSGSSSDLHEIIQDAEQRKDKILTGSSSSGRPQPEVSETDLQLLHALEKLVGRIDKLESRVSKMEDLFIYLLQGNKPPAARTCPSEFTDLGQGQCYLFSRSLNRRLDWKAAHTFCQDLGAKLIEMETMDEHDLVMGHLGSQPHLKGSSYWAGGLNPGLVWIWSDSGRQIPSDSRLWASREDMKQGSGLYANSPRRCLRLRPVRKAVFKYAAAVCGDTDYFVCEYDDNVAARQLRGLHQELLQRPK